MCIRDRCDADEDPEPARERSFWYRSGHGHQHATAQPQRGCLLYTSDAADERSSVDLGGRRIIKKKKDQV